jgi:hypothetical protein
MFITCSESHYSVLFSEDTSCTQSSDAIVELFYYDELGKQDELYRLTVTPNREAGARAPTSFFERSIQLSTTGIFCRFFKKIQYY